MLYTDDDKRKPNLYFNKGCVCCIICNRITDTTDRNIFVPDKAPKFETFLSVGDVFNFRNLTFEDKPFNTTLISYYDRIDDFNFNSTTGKFSWSMPFYYEVQRLEKNPIFVHEEKQGNQINKVTTMIQSIQKQEQANSTKGAGVTQPLS